MTSLKRLALFASLGIGLTCAAESWTDLLDAGAFLAYRGGLIDHTTLKDSTGLRLPSVLSSLLLLTAGVLFLAWLGRARRNLAELPDADPSYTPGWAIGAWFIPLANLVMPGIVVADVAVNSVAAADSARRTRLKRLVWVWWGAYIGRAVGQYILAFAGVSSINAVTYAVMEVLLTAVFIGAGVLAVLVIRTITAAQGASFERRPIGPDPADFPSFTVDDVQNQAA